MRADVLRKGGRLCAALAFCAVAGCTDPAKGWTLQEEQGSAVIMSPQDARDCFVVLNSLEGGFHKIGRTDFVASVSQNLPLSEFQNSRGEVPAVVLDALIQCGVPTGVVRLQRE